MNGSAALRLANVVCALILVATTPKRAVLVRALRRAMIRSWNSLIARCVTWAASRELSTTLQVLAAGNSAVIAPGRLDVNAFGHAGLYGRRGGQETMRGGY